MHNYPEEILFNLESNQVLSIGLIVKIPKDYRPGKLIISLVGLLGVKLNLLGMIVGFESDRFNWLSFKVTAELDRITATLIYLNNLGIQTTFFKVDN